MLMLPALLLGAFGCKDNKPTDPVRDYDRAAMLVNIGNNIIVPGYEDFETQATLLQAAIADFGSNPDLSGLDAAQAALKSTWLSWQRISSYEFGPAASVILRTAVNTFPADPATIDANITAGTWNLETASNIDARGLPALDYLLNGLGADDNAILDAYTTAVDSTERIAYISDLAADIKALATAVRTDWGSAGLNYISGFTDKLGTDVGSSTGFLVNELNFDLEILKNPRLGIPVGIQTLGQALPEKVEAYYGGYSAELAVAHFDALADLYKGKSAAGVDGYGLLEALRAIEAPYNGGLLADAIADQIASTKSALAALTDPLSAQVTSDPTTVEAAYNEVKKMVTLWKTDMSSALGILITYQDNDGD